MDYSKIVQEGMWVHKTIEKSPSIEVIGCDFHRKTVTLTDNRTMDMEKLVKDYMIPRFEGVDLGRFETDQLLGGLNKESNQPRQIYKDEVDQVIEKAENFAFLSEKSIKLEEEEVELPPSQRMLFDSINLTSGQETKVQTNIQANFNFDIKKIIQMAKIFDIDSENVVKSILATENGKQTLELILTNIVDTMMSE